MSKKHTKRPVKQEQVVDHTSQPEPTHAPALPEPTRTVDQPRKKFSAWIIGVVLAVVSAFGAATLSQTTDIFKEDIKPLVNDASCSLTEFWRSNTTEDRFTVVVLPFSNDPKNTAQSSIGEALANEYGLNVISSCSSIQISTSGNREENLENARKRATSLLDKYDADMLIFGALKLDKSGAATDQSQIVVTSKKHLSYLYTNGLVYTDLFDGSKPDAYVRRREFVSALVEYADAIGESSGCFNTVLGICDSKAGHLSSDQLADKLERIYQVQHVYVNELFWTFPDRETRRHFFQLGDYVAAIATELYSNRGVKELRTRETKEPNSLLNIAEHSLKWSDRFSQQDIPDPVFAPQTIDDSYHDHWAAMEIGEIRLLHGEACSSEFYLGLAREAFNYGQPKATAALDVDYGNRLTPALSLLASARTKLALYAVTQENAKELRADFEKEAQQTLDSISMHRHLILSSVDYGTDNSDILKEADKKIDGEISLIQQGLKENDQARLRRLLKMSSCQE
jgi:hypothetical protein